jgi:hypothetical protein
MGTFKVIRNQLGSTAKKCIWNYVYSIHFCYSWIA